MHLGALHPEICVCDDLGALHPEMCCVCTVIYIIYKKTKHFFRSFLFGLIWQLSLPPLTLQLAEALPAKRMRKDTNSEILVHGS